ncbi:MAG TPA: integrin alpha, partial [Myxococcota bacterium]|nr:integrin alpha [Myxococcota bacterium]
GGDLTGDGDEDLALSSFAVTTVWVIAAADLVNGADSAGNLSSSSVIGTTFFSSTQLEFGLLGGSFADLNDDGAVDLLASGDDAVAHYGMSFGFFAPLSGSNTTEDDASASWIGDNPTDGTRVAAAGDLDGDGIADVVTGSPYDYTYPLSRQGVLGIFTGPAGGDKNLINASAQINGTTSYDRLGWSLQVQDLNGDGYADILAGAPDVSTMVTSGGAVYVIPGGSLSGTLTVANVAQTTIYGATAGTGLGTDRIPLQGDGDGDGTTDLLLTSVTNNWVGLWWNVAGLPAAAYDGSSDVTFPTPTDLGEAAIFDFDGDGSDDVLIGDPGDDFFGVDAGAVWIYTNGAAWDGELSGFDAVIGGTNAGDGLGSSLVGGRDFDSNGNLDLIVGASGHDGGGSNSGAVYRVDLP